MSGGYFVLDPDGPKERRIKNKLVKDGAEAFLRAIFQKISFGDSVYVGLTGARYEFDTATLAVIAADEPVGNGYMRLLLNRDNADWDVSAVSSLWRARSKTVTWTATADWTKVWSRMFLCDAADGTDGVVYSLSGPTASGQITKNGAPVSLAYEYWLRG